MPQRQVATGKAVFAAWNVLSGTGYMCAGIILLNFYVNSHDALNCRRVADRQFHVFDSKAFEMTKYTFGSALDRDNYTGLF